MKRKSNYVRMFVIASVLLLGAAQQVWAANDFDTFMEHIRTEGATNPSTSKIDGYMEKMNVSTGAFSDVNYADRGVTTWKPIDHLSRLTDMVFAYTNEKNKYYGDEQLYNTIVKALQYWQDYNPESDNWWNNMIAEPQKMGIILIQMRAGKKQLPNDLEKKLLQRMQQDGGDPAKYTGANRTDIALHCIYRACLQANKNDLQKALNYIYETIAYTTEEGFQYDNSYCQHGKQLYIGGYGDAILRVVTQVAMYAAGTSFALPEDKLELLRHFLLETYFPTIRGQYMMYDVMGREISRRNATKKSSSAVFATRMAEIDSANAAEYEAIAKRLNGKSGASTNISPMHNHYYCSDYTLHVRENYTFDVRLASTRTYRCEYGNDENIKTYFLSDGCNNIALTGKEYVNIFPMWDWARIPGTTAPQLKSIPLPSREWGSFGSATFAGGATDGMYGVTAYAYEDTYSGINTGAHKGWFFFDDEVVCLGAGINSTNSANVNTTINQCLSSATTAVSVSNNGKVSAMSGASSVEHSPEWVLHDDVAYIFPKGGTVFIEKAEKKANWQEINPPASSHEETGVVFTLGIDHGKKPKNDTYAYIVLCGAKTAADVEAYCSKGDIEIIANDTRQQSVRHKGLGLWEVIFYDAGTFSDDDLSITVDHPCTLLLREFEDKSLSLHIADPSQAGKNIKVDVDYPSLLSSKQTITAQFAGKGIYAGATLDFTIK